MARVSVSEAEKVYVLHGVQEDIRVDGRRRGDLRPLMVESDLVTHTSGSAHLRLANTDVLVGVKVRPSTGCPTNTVLFDTPLFWDIR